MAAPAAAKKSTKPGARKQAEKLYYFAWTGTDNRGKKMKGEMRAPNDGAVKSELRKQNITIISGVKEDSKDFTTLYAKNNLVIIRFACPFERNLRLGLPRLRWLGNRHAVRNQSLDATVRKRREMFDEV